MIQSAPTDLIHAGNTGGRRTSCLQDGGAMDFTLDLVAAVTSDGICDARNSPNALLI